MLITSTLSKILEGFIRNKAYSRKNLADLLNTFLAAFIFGGFVCKIVTRITISLLEDLKVDIYALLVTMFMKPFGVQHW